MKKIPALMAALGLLAFLTPAGVSAAEGPKARLFAKYDANKNGIIDGDEIAAVRKAYAADPKGEFARYDLNHDGQLDDKEIAEIKPPGAKKGRRRQKVRGQEEGQARGKARGQVDRSVPP